MSHHGKDRPVTPLPAVQIMCLFFIQLCETLNSKEYRTFLIGLREIDLF
jgi:hypothetical protein